MLYGCMQQGRKTVAEEHRSQPRARKWYVAILFVAAAALLSIGLVCGIRYGYRLMESQWLKSDSGQVYTPGGAAKKVIKKLKE